MKAEKKVNIEYEYEVGDTVQNNLQFQKASGSQGGFTGIKRSKQYMGDYDDGEPFCEKLGFEDEQEEGG